MIKPFDSSAARQAASRLWLATASSFAVFAATAAHAQSPAQPATVAEAVGLEDIVVTAQRRGQNLQDVPVSVTAFRADALEQAGVTEAIDLQQVDSSLTISAQSGIIIPFLRGIGNPGSQAAGNESSVPVYIDDVYYSRLYAPYMALTNIERVEVLKGPQGTLFGRNATGGLIQIFTRDPGQETEVDATAGYANYDTISGKLYAATPLGANAAIDLSLAGSDQRDGWGYNFGNGKETYRTKFYSIRSKLVADLTETTRVRLTGFYVYQWSNQGEVQGKIYAGTRGLPPTYAEQLIEPEGFYDLNTDTENFHRHRGWGGSLKIDQELSFADISSISSYRRGKEFWNSEGDHTYVPFLNYQLNIRDRQITQELQLKSKRDSAISLLLGGYYINSRQGYLPTTILGDAITGGPGNPAGITSVNYYGLQTINSYAGFGQATFPVVDDKTNITLGLRYTKDYVKGEGRKRAMLVTGGEVPIAPDYNQKVNFDKLTYKVTVDHKFVEDVMAYVAFSRGYKSGTFNTLPLDAPPTDPETVDAYEAGVKLQAFDNRLRTNVAVFQNDIRNPQVGLIKNVDGVASVQFANAGKARTRGVEFDSIALLAEGLTLNLAGQYLDAKFLDFQGAPFNFPVVGPPFGIVAPAVSADASGNRMPQTPKWKLNVGVNYDVETPVGAMTFNVNMAYRSSFKWDPDNILTEPSLTLFNSSITLKPAFDEHLSLRLWGSNLTNEKYYSNELPQSGPVGYMGSVAEPRTYGIEARYVF